MNNWGLVLQELSGVRPPAERSFLVMHAVAKFRHAIRLRPEFDRACYNLGTVYYAHAVALKAAAAQHLSPELAEVSFECPRRVLGVPKGVLGVPKEVLNVWKVAGLLSSSSPWSRKVLRGP